MHTTYGWNTKKTETGFTSIVTKHVSRKTPNADGQYADTTIVKRFSGSTRARVMGAAKRWCLYYRRTAA